MNADCLINFQALPCLEIVRPYSVDTTTTLYDSEDDFEDHSAADVTAWTAWSCDGSCVSASTAIFCRLVGLGREMIKTSIPALQVSRHVDLSSARVSSSSAGMWHNWVGSVV